MTIFKMSIIFLILCVGCSSFSMDKEYFSVDTKSCNVKFNMSDFIYYQPIEDMSLYSGSNSNIVRVWLVREDWYLFVNIYNLKSKDINNRFYKSSEEAIRKIIEQKTEKRNLKLNDNENQILTGTLIDSTFRSTSSKVGVMYFQTEIASTKLLGQIVKYHYKQADKPEFQNILNRFTITEKN